MHRPRIIALSLALVVSVAAADRARAGSAKIEVAPDKTALTPDLLKQPIAITGSGWGPNEVIVVNLVVPKGVTVKGIKEGEDVGVASGNADGEGNLKTVVGPTAILMTFFQTGWDDNAMKPDFKQASPLPPGEYKLLAVGFESEKKAEATLTLLPPPEKK